MKVSELTGAFLDYWVGKALGADVELKKVDPAEQSEDGLYVRRWSGCEGARRAYDFSPHTCWTDGGPIIEREIVDLERDDIVEDWRAVHRSHMTENPASAHGETPLIAAMRAYVASKFGPEVPDHKEQ